MSITESRDRLGSQSLSECFYKYIKRGSRFEIIFKNCSSLKIISVLEGVVKRSRKVSISELLF